MRRDAKYYIALSTALLFAAVTPAYADPVTDLSRADAAWVKASTLAPPLPPSPPRVATISANSPRGRTSHDAVSAKARQEDDFKAECLKQPASRTSDGWTKSRYEQCFVGKQDIVLRDKRTGAKFARVFFDYIALAFAYTDSRKVDYVFDSDKFEKEGGFPLEETFLSVEFTGCTSAAPCDLDPAKKEQLVAPDWLNGNRRLQVRMSSPDDTGSGPFKTVDSLLQLSFYLHTPTHPEFDPYSDIAVANSRVRFDSARNALGNGPFHGSVFTDHIPTMTFDLRPESNHRAVARHIKDALDNPRRTFPSFIGKSVPRTLHRLMGPEKDDNARAAQGICRDVWGNYPEGGLECDEFPFQSTKEGAYTSTGGNPLRWHGSARPILAADNARGGALMSTTYGQNRILEGDAFIVAVQE